MIVVDTSALVGSLAGHSESPSSLRLRSLIAEGERLMIPTLVLYEWLRGPRQALELALQEALFPVQNNIQLGRAEAELSATIYKSIRRPRGREIDIAIAACAVLRGAPIWTLNPSDFADIPGLRLLPARP